MNAQSSNKPIETLRVRFPIGKTVPDPAHIQVTGEWYLLDHLSSGLVHFDSKSGNFEPLLAKEWQIKEDHTHVFTLRDDIKFSDGSPILASDVVASLKRLLIKKTSTHFPIWEYVEGCDSLSKLSDECSGLREISDKVIEIRLKFRNISFFLQLSSPETGIWSKNDIDPETLDLTPTRYSGPYTLESHTEDTGFFLKRNEQSLISKNFPNSPRKIVIPIYKPSLEADDRIANGDLDLLIRSHRPFGEKNWESFDVEVQSSSPSTLIFLHGTNPNESAVKIGRDLLTAIWERNQIKDLIPATTFLPFDESYRLEETVFLNELSPATSPYIRIAVPHTYFASGFLDFLKESAKSIGTEIEYIVLNPYDYFKALQDREAHLKFDYIIAPYVASERYPAVQLRFITGFKKPNIDLKPTETPNMTAEHLEILKNYQRWLLSKGHAVPLFFARTQILFNKNINLGEQSSPDSEVELWRLSQKE